MTSYKVETDNPDYIRDTGNNALLNRNRKERDQIQADRVKARKAAILEDRVKTLEDELQQLKDFIYGSKT